MLIRSETYVETDARQQARDLGTTMPAPATTRCVIPVDRIQLYEETCSEVAPGTMLYFADGTSVSIAMPFERFDELYTRWYEGRVAVHPWRV